MIIVLQGPDTFRSARRFRQLRQAFSDKHDQAGLATTILDGLAMTVESLHEALGSGGLFSTKRYIGISDYDPKQSAVSPERLAEILSPVAQDADRIVVLRLVSAPPRARKGKSLPRSNSFSLPGAKEELFLMLSSAEVLAWIEKEVRSLGGKITPAVARQLHERAGDSLWRLEQEIQKLVMAGDGTITTDLITEHVTHDIQSDIFRLTDALGSGRPAEALRFLRRELDAGTHPLALITVLSRHVQILWQVRRLLDLGERPQAEDLGIHPYVLQKASAQAGRLTEGDLARWHKALLMIDYDLKTSPLGAETLLERFAMLGRSSAV